LGKDVVDFVDSCDLALLWMIQMLFDEEQYDGAMIIAIAMASDSSGLVLFVHKLTPQPVFGVFC
jgi:hypothetical protein